MPQSFDFGFMWLFTLISIISKGPISKYLSNTPKAQQHTKMCKHYQIIDDTKPGVSLI